MRAMTKEQIAVFNELLETPNFQGKKQLKHLLWLNSNQPKFKEGDCFVISDGGHNIFGKPVVDFKAKVVVATSFKDREEWFYHLEMVAKHNGRTITSNAYKYESELENAERAEDNINIIE